MATLEEQETIITQNRVDNYVSVYTTNTHDLAYFGKNKAFELVREWFDSETGEREAAEFRLPKTRANVRKIVKATRNLSSDQRQALADRLSKARNSN